MCIRDSWKSSRYPVEASDSLHHYAGALCMGVDASGACASVFYVVELSLIHI